MNLAEIKERHSKVGGTPWKASEYSCDYYVQGYSVRTWNDGYIAECIEEQGEVDFIANAPTDISWLIEQLEQAEKVLNNSLKLIGDYKQEAESSEAYKRAEIGIDEISGFLKSIQGEG